MLKPCPFCGSKTITIRYEGQPAMKYAFACQDCGGTTGSVYVGGTASGSTVSFNNPAATEAWNRRALEAPSEAKGEN